MKHVLFVGLALTLTFHFALESTLHRRCKTPRSLPAKINMSCSMLCMLQVTPSFRRPWQTKYQQMLVRFNDQVLQAMFQNSKIQHCKNAGFPSFSTPHCEVKTPRRWGKIRSPRKRTRRRKVRKKKRRNQAKKKRKRRARKRRSRRTRTREAERKRRRGARKSARGDLDGCCCSDKMHTFARLVDALGDDKIEEPVFAIPTLLTTLSWPSLEHTDGCYFLIDMLASHKDGIFV